MPRQSHTAEQIIRLLRQAEVEMSQGRRIGAICRGLGVSQASLHQWRAEYDDLQVDQVSDPRV
ncbi:transposase [Roseomonas sp. HJA6]|uniref:Transposase n=1 Tax=Roseomonas alba TaxID=2846776 RepID=A0ABS7AAD7_9PROT|nr:transposase [Neoroseomonas alba]